jgi:peptide deformylase
MPLDILIYPDKRLREVSTPVDPKTIADPAFQKLLDEMFATMYAAPGVGLAAVQIGVLQRVMVMDIGINEGEVVKRDPRVVINPEYVHQEGSVVWEEGCLSCPDLVVPMKRFQRVKIHSLDRHGQPQELEGVDLLAVAIQHEIDHMDGKLILDQLSRLKRNIYTDKVQKGKIAIR